MKQSLLLLLITLIVIGCKKDKEVPNYSFVNPSVIHYDESHQFEVQNNQKQVGSNLVSYSSSDESVGNINATGLFTAKKVGQTTITGSVNGKNFSTVVTVKPYSTFYTEPSVEFGANQNAIRSYERRVEEESAINYLYYKGENYKILQVLYVFEELKMQTAIVQFRTTEEIGSEVITFLKERYSYLGENEGYFYFSDNKTVLIGLNVDKTLGLVAGYIKYNGPTGKTAAIQSLKKQMKQLVK